MMMICWVYSSTKKRDVVHSGNCCFHIGCLFLWPQKLTPLRPFLFHPPFVLSRAESYIVLTKSMWFLPKLPFLPSLYLFTKKFCVEGCLLGLMMGLKGWFATTSRTWPQEKKSARSSKHGTYSTYCGVLQNSISRGLFHPIFPLLS